MSENKIIHLVDVYKEYSQSSILPVTPVLLGVTLSITQGETVSISGPSGSGKSTLLNIMGALDKSTSGNVIFNGEEISKLNDEKLSFLRNREIGFVFQAHHLIPQCTVLENVLIPSIPFPKKTQEEYFEKALQLLEYVGLKERINHKPSELSGGEKLRTAVVRSLINEPKILLADEPTGSLDDKTAMDLANLLVELNRSNNMTIVVVTHSAKMASMMNEKYELKGGKLNLL